jgi:hypothetical protein
LKIDLFAQTLTTESVVQSCDRTPDLNSSPETMG